MIYPEPLRHGSRIAITAFSAGISDVHERRFYSTTPSMPPFILVRAIHNMQFRDVFTQINALILGRNFRADSENQFDLTWLDVLHEHLANKNIPVLYDVDIGHVPPNLTLINGSYAEISVIDGSGTVRQWLK
ncbi:MAG: hypothetical protein KKD00_08795 [Gammaproteobacteria bacterium]|nr:hypothetical protein [Gammaproteobacteria bacterium]